MKPTIVFKSPNALNNQVTVGSNILTRTSKSSGGYWVRRMRQSPQVPPFFGAPPSKTAYTVLDSLRMFAQRTIRSEDLFFFRERLDFGRKIGKLEMKLK